MAVKKPVVSSGVGKELPYLFPAEQMERWPHLTEFLGCPYYDDGSKRKTGTLFIFVERGEVRIALNDRETGSTAWSGGEGFLEAMDNLNSSLGEDSLDWRQQKGKR